MKIPPKFVISEKDAVLGTTTSKGLKKHGLDPPAKIGKHNEFLALINGYKPIIGANEEKLRERIIKYRSLKLYVRSIKVYMLDGRFWIDKKEKKKSYTFHSIQQKRIH